MFERYNDLARRALFYARQEASSLGGPMLDTEHVLLGILKAREPLVLHLLDRMGVTADEVRQLIHSRIGTPQQHVDLSVEMPFSDDSKDVFKYTAEEADILLDRHIGCEHVLLGLLRHERGLAWEVLREKGLSITPVREALVMHVSATRPLPPEIAGIVSGMADALRSRVEHVERKQRSPDLYHMTVLKNPVPGRRATAEEPASFFGMSFGHVSFNTRSDRPPDERMHSIGPISMGATTLPQFALLLEGFLGASVVVEDTDLAAAFDIELTGEYDNADALIAALRDQLGLVLTKNV
jgi:hypothetical protein